jgi:hypothetical protein
LFRKILLAARLDGLDEVVHEFFGRNVKNLDVRILFHHEIADGLQQVGFSQADPAVNKQGVVGAGWRLRYR